MEFDGLCGLCYFGDVVVVDATSGHYDYAVVGLLDELGYECGALFGCGLLA